MFLARRLRLLKSTNQREIIFWAWRLLHRQKSMPRTTSTALERGNVGFALKLKEEYLPSNREKAKGKMQRNDACLLGIQVVYEGDPGMNDLGTSQPYTFSSAHAGTLVVQASH